MPTIANTRQFEEWNGTDGRHWAEYHERYDRMAGQYNAPLLAAAALGEHDQVLDVGCGTGHTTRLAARAANRGRAVGLDLSAPMLERARRTAAAEGIANAAFEQGDAQVHPLGSARFDTVISRAGVMFFADPVAAFTNIATATKPGGRLAFVCHREPGEDVQAVFAAVAEHLPMPDPAEQAPGVADFADPDQVRAVLTASGFASVSATGFEVLSPIGRDAGDATDFLFSAQLRSIAGGAGAADETARQRAHAAVRNILRSFEVDGAVRIPARGWLVTATRS
ncbi:methyltransferase domain-containing protein [Streptomonospora sediminis]